MGRKGAPSTGIPSGIPPGTATDPKSMVNTGFMILCGRSLTKAELEYKVTIDEQRGSVAATLTLKCIEGMPVYEGKPVLGITKENKKKAEQNAAEAAYRAYKTEIDQKMPEHQAKKAAKKAEFGARIEALRDQEALEKEQEADLGE